jgi:hypothetical protein
VNKDLYNRSKGQIEFPKEKRELLKRNFDSVKSVSNDETEGYKRNLELQNKRFIDYKQLKRIKNWFDSFNGNEKDPSFILNGGFEMKNWVNDSLRKMREYSKMTKTNKMDTGMENQFIDTHTKDGIDVRPSKEHVRTVDRYNQQVTESLRRINEIISKI